MRQRLHVLLETVRVETLDRGDDIDVEGAPPVVEQAAVCDLVGQRVLERVFELRQEPVLVEELGRLEAARGRPGTGSSGIPAIACSSAARPGSCR